MNWNIKILFVAATLLTGCGVDNPEKPPVVIPPKPEIAESVVPTARAIADTNERLRNTIEEQEDTIQVQQQEIDRALAIAEAIRSKLETDIPIEKVDAANLIQELEKIRGTNLWLKEQNSKLTAENKEIAALARKNELLATKKDEETKAWESAYAIQTQSIVQLSDIVDQKDDVIADRDKEVKKLTKKAASAGVYRSWVIGLASSFIVWTILKNVLMIYFPGFKGRI